MEKPKQVTILSLAILGVMYGATTASATPFLTLIHDFVAFATSKAPANSSSASNALTHNAEMSNATGPMNIPPIFLVDVPLALTEHVQSVTFDMYMASRGDLPASHSASQEQGAFPTQAAGSFSSAQGNSTNAYASSNLAGRSTDYLAQFPLEPAVAYPTLPHYVEKGKTITADSDKEDQLEREKKPIVVASDIDSPLAKVPGDQPRLPQAEDDLGKAGKPAGDEKAKDKDAASDAGIPVTSVPRVGDLRPITNEGDKLAGTDTTALPKQKSLCDVNPNAYGCVDRVGGASQPISAMSAIQAVPESGSLALLSLGIVGLGFIRGRRT